MENKSPIATVKLQSVVTCAVVLVQADGDVAALLVGGGAGVVRVRRLAGAAPGARAARRQPRAAVRAARRRLRRARRAARARRLAPPAPVRERALVSSAPLLYGQQYGNALCY